jgi:membrane protein implicated in regulation of membrane protease activity
MLGEQGIATSGLQSGVEGMIRIHGETWRAIANEAVAPGEPVRVRKIEGLKLYVEPAKTESAANISADRVRERGGL